MIQCLSKNCDNYNHETKNCFRFVVTVKDGKCNDFYERPNPKQIEKVKTKCFGKDCYSCDAELCLVNKTNELIDAVNKLMEGKE